MNLHNDTPTEASGIQKAFNDPLLRAMSVLAVLVVVFFAGALFDKVVLADGGSTNLLDKVTEGQRYGFPADNVGEEVCFFLIKEDRTSETHKSCVVRDQVLNLGKAHEELGSVNVEQGVGVFRISRDTRYGVSDGVILEPVSQEDLPEPSPTPAPSPGSEETEDNIPTDLPGAGGS